MLDKHARVFETWRTPHQSEELDSTTIARIAIGEWARAGKENYPGLVGLEMAAQLYMPTLLLILGTVLIVFGMKYVSAALQARSRAANERSFQRLAEEAHATQAQHVALLSSMQSSISDIGTRLGQVERILKEVG